MLAYLRVLTNQDDDSAFMRIVNTPKREIGSATIQKLGEWANLRNKSLFRASFDLGLGEHLKRPVWSHCSGLPIGWKALFG